MDIQDFADSIPEGNLCDLGYTLRDLNWAVYCRWVCDCAEHVLPLTESLISPDETETLRTALETAREFEDAESACANFDDAVAQVSAIHNRVYSESGMKYAHATEALEAVCNAVKQADPHSRIYHEDVVYGAARAAFNGELHADDTADPILESDCCDVSELEGSQESHKEQAWQLDAMKRRVEEAVYLNQAMRRNGGGDVSGTG